MADERLIPAGIKDENSEVFNELIDRLGTIDITPVIIYLIDEVESTALPHLAEQFHVGGLEGWNLCETDEEKRTLIKKAIDLHRYKGTPWAIKEALKAVGYQDAEIQEGIAGVYYDGTLSYDGYEVYRGDVNTWAIFRVLLDIGENKSLTQVQVSRIIDLVKEFKNVRSHLRDVCFKYNQEDTVEEPSGDTAEVDITEHFYYDGQYSYAGAETYDGIIEVVSEVF